MSDSANDQPRRQQPLRPRLLLRHHRRQSQRRSRRGQPAPPRPGDRPGARHRRLPQTQDPQLRRPGRTASSPRTRSTSRRRPSSTSSTSAPIRPSRSTPKKRTAKGKEKAEEDRRLTRWMCDNFFDVRAFGAVMTTDVNCGQVRGPVQFGLARSLHPIVSQEHAVTRCAVTTDAKPSSRRGATARWAASSPSPTPSTASTATSTPTSRPGPTAPGFSEDDLALLKRALDQMFEFDKSAARANMRPVACIAFRHESPLGNARADRLFARVVCKPKAGVQPLPGEADGESQRRPSAPLVRRLRADRRRRGPSRGRDRRALDRLDLTPWRTPNRDFLPISALQHLIFCERQCALIHLERLWVENRFTAEGGVLHQKAHSGRSEKQTRPAGLRAPCRCGPPSSASTASPTSSRPAGGRPAHARRVQARPPQVARRRPRAALRPGPLPRGDVRRARPAGEIFYGKTRRRVARRVRRRLRAPRRARPSPASATSSSPVGRPRPSQARSAATARSRRSACRSWRRRVGP